MYTLSIEIEYIVSDPDYTLVWECQVTDSEGETESLELPMQKCGDVWTLDWRYPAHCDHTSILSLSYNYRLDYKGRTVRYEAPTCHRLDLCATRALRVSLQDRWIEPNPLHRLTQYPMSVLVDIPAHSDVPILVEDTMSILLVTHFPHQTTGRLVLCGECDHLGRWSPSAALEMKRSGDTYHCTLPSDGGEYKMVLLLEDGTCIWEEGQNRRLPSVTIPSVYHIDSPKFVGFDPAPKRQYTGTVAPLFSLRTSASYGVGDLSDALDFLDWLRDTGQSVYQLLPIYDTTFTQTDADTYPYNSITTYGIHPLYLSVRDLPRYGDAPGRELWEEEARRLNALETVDYISSLRLKWEVIHYCFSHWYADHGFEEEAFRRYWDTEYDLLLPYCLFCVLRDRAIGRQVIDYPDYSTQKQEWEATKTLEGLEAHQEVMKYAYVQYHLYRQLSALSQKAIALKILLKGDLPIGVGRNSVDVWVAPSLFDLDMCAGAPPDAFAEAGQWWGFPTYDWDAMKEDGYLWWKHRLSHMGRFFSAIRIDHILGFFRIWSIPVGEENPCLGRFVPAIGYTEVELQSRGIDPYTLSSDKDPNRLLIRDGQGLYHPRVMLMKSPMLGSLSPEKAQRLIDLHDEYYYSRNEDLWRLTAMERLMGLRRGSSMLLCAEDLGMLPRSVTEVLRDLELFSLEIIRMPKSTAASIVRPQDIPRLSVLSTSTHDMDTLRGWWSSLTDREAGDLEVYYGQRLEGEPITPSQLLTSLFETEATFVILPLQDWCVYSGYGAEVSPQLERINIPENPHHVWNYRMYKTIHDLSQDHVLANNIRRLRLSTHHLSVI